jgi:hypothetical protein
LQDIAIATSIPAFSRATWEAIVAGIKEWFYDPGAEPDFKQIVDKSLVLFGVFTGATLSFYVKDFLLAD